MSNDVGIDANEMREIVDDFLVEADELIQSLDSNLVTLENTPHDDFGAQIIPNAMSTHAIYGFDFEGYWEDIGTIRSFCETNLLLAQPDPPFNFYDPLRLTALQYPPRHRA